MKKIIPAAILIFFSFLGNLLAEDIRIAYMIPDIGAPGMNIYAEIIALEGKDGFGSDAIYPNNPGDSVRVELYYPSDSTKVIIGPIAVGWNGRMISTHFFVMPWVNPNTDNWQTVASNFKIPFRVKVGPYYSNVDTFYIIQPSVFGDKSSNPERVLGEGSLLRRSKRGAMIVNDMKLANAVYTVSTNDCDPNMLGNQGYLPFVLLAKSKIIGSGALSAISVDGRTPHGGPGGGGGGGKFCDGSILNPLTGDDGGSGYAGGGPGGRNGSGVSNVFKKPGTGTGPDGFSLSNQNPGNAPWYEASGGGTGHPFGLSGDGCSSGPSCDPDGKQGGGSGYRDNQNGGAGGFGSDGANSSTKNGGKKHGNSMLVPLAGGSGGGSGNPNSAHQCGGNGGGGGGAIRISALRIENLGITANGGAPGNSTYGVARGGAGSAGGIDFQTKLGSSDNFLNTSSSTGGGGGRVRIDSPDTVSVNLTYSLGGGTLFNGLSTDTITFTKRHFTLKGSANSNYQYLHTYYKSLTGPWIRGNSVLIPSGKKAIDIPVDLPPGDSLYLMVAYQENTGASQTQYNMEPRFIMSQSAANLFRIDNYPIIDGDKEWTLKIIQCQYLETDTILKIRNKGDSNLELDFEFARFQSLTPGLEILSPKQKTILKPDDSVSVRLKFTYRGKKKGKIVDYLIVDHNDNRSSQNPWIVKITIIIDSLNFDSYNLALTKTLDTVDFGKVCIYESSQFDFAVKVGQNSIINLFNPDFDDRSNFFSWIEGKRLLNPVLNDTTTLSIVFTPQNFGKIETHMYIKVAECPDYVDTVFIRGEGVQSDLRFNTDYSFVQSVGYKDTAYLYLLNDGEGDVLIDYLPILADPFKIISTTPPLPYLLRKGDSIKVGIEYTPLNENLDSVWLKASSLDMVNTCRDSAQALLKGKGTKAFVFVSLDSVDLGVFPWCGVSRDTAIILKNNGSGTFRVLQDPEIYGSDSAHFTIAQNLSSLIFPPGRADTIWVKFFGIRGSDGVKNAFIRIPTDDPQSSEIIVNLHAEQEGLKIDIDPVTFDFGTVPIGKPNVMKVFTLKNNGKIRRHLYGITSTNPDYTANPVVADLVGGASAPITVTFLPDSAGPSNTTLTFLYDTPCRDTQYVQIRGKGIEGTISYNDSVYFGMVTSCESAIDSVIYINTGQASVRFDTLYIQGPDAGLFTILNPPTYPFNVDTSGVFKIQVRFSPKNSANGLKSAELVAKVYMDNKNKVFSSSLAGERIIPFRADPQTLSFATQVTNTSQDLNLRIYNDGVKPFTILRINSAYIGFVLNMTPNPSGRVIPPMSFQDFTMTLTPDAEKQYFDTLKFDIQYSGCRDTSVVYMTGSGIPPRKITLSIPEAQVMTNINNYRIPVYASLEMEKDSISGISLEAEINLNSTMFYPQSLSNGVIVANRVQNGLRHLRFRTDKLTIKGTNMLLTEIIGATALGNDDTTDIKWDSLIWSDPAYFGIIDTVHGRLFSIICKEGGDRLIEQTNPINLTIVPNPAQGNVEIECDLLENGEHCIELFSSDGSRKELARWISSDANTKHFSFSYDLSEFSSGIYFIVLKTPNRVKTQRISIIK